MLKRFLAILAVAAFGAALSSTAAQALDNKLQEIEDAGVLRACLAESIPNAYVDPKTEKWTGFQTDMGAELAKELGVELELVDATWATIIESVRTDKCDVALVGLFRLAKRARVILFVNPFVVTTLSAAVAEGSQLNTYAALDDPNVSISVISGTAEEAYFKSGTAADVRSMVTDKIATIFLEVANNRADVVITDTITLRRFLSENPALKLRELDDTPIAPRGAGYAVAPGEYHLQHFLNVWLERMETSGRKAAFWNKWHTPTE